MRPQCCSCCDEGERIFTYLLNHLKIKHYEDYRRHSPDTILQICNCPEALRLKFQFVNHILFQKISNDKIGNCNTAMPYEVIVKTEVDLDEEAIERPAGSSAPPEVNGAESCDTVAIVQHLRSVEANLMNEMRQMHSSLAEQLAGKAVELESLGFPMSKDHHVMSLADFLRDNEKYRDAFTSALANFIRILPQNLDDRDTCSIIYSKLFSVDPQYPSNAAEHSKSARKITKLDEIIVDTVVEVMTKTRNRNDKKDIKIVFARVANHSMKNQNYLEHELTGSPHKRIKFSHNVYDYASFEAHDDKESTQGSSSSLV